MSSLLSMKSYTGDVKSDVKTLATTFFEKEPISDLPLEPLNNAYETIQNNFYGYSTVQKQKIVEGMIRGMTQALGDKHSDYFDVSEMKDFNQAIDGNFEGIGAFVGKTQSGVLIRHIFDNSPAKESKILEWDIITTVDGQWVANLTLEDAVKKIRWPADSTVNLVILRPGKPEQTLEKKVVRKSVNIPSVVSKMLENHVWVITVGIFGKNTAEDFAKEYTSLSGSGMKALIVDLRDNPGGLLDTSVSLLENFIPTGKLLVETRGTHPRDNNKYFAENNTPSSIPMVVIVNENSASASEIFAGALQDYNRALIVGTKSYGKGSVQEVFPLGETGELKITIARWYTPMGKWIDGIGIQPDIVAKVEDKDLENQFDRALDVALKNAEKLSKGTPLSDLKK